MKINVRLIYLYLFSFVGLLIIVIGTVRMVDLGLKVLVFKDADKFEYYAPRPVEEGTKVEYNEEEEKERAKREQERSRQREIAGSLAMIIVGIPLYLYHWRTIQKENKS